MSKKSLVALAHGLDVQENVTRVFDMMGGAAKMIEPNSTVVLKPNAGHAAPPEFAVCTHPETVRAVIREVKKANPKRIVIAEAALAEYEAPMILMDLGTATTIEVVEPNNMYLGGIIFPGVRVSLDALTSRTAQLPGISLDKPKHVIGKNTVDCMRSGMMYGTAAMLDGLVERIEAELGHKSTLIATGGLAQFITPLCKREIILEKDLLLKGLNVIYKKNKR